jgi:dihydroneopterin aldolase
MKSKEGLKSVYLEHSASMNGLQKKLNTDSNYRNFSATYKAEMEAKERETISSATRQKLEELEKQIDADRKTIALKIAKLKFPLMSSLDPMERLSGELQANSALLFRSSDIENITSELENAFTLGRTDYAFSIIRNALSGVKTDPYGQLSKENQNLLNEIQSVEKQYGKHEELALADSEFRDLPAVESMVQSFKQQLGLTKNIVLPGLYSALDERGRAEMQEAVASSGSSLLERVAFKNRIAENS